METWRKSLLGMGVDVVQTPSESKLRLWDALRKASIATTRQALGIVARSTVRMVPKVVTSEGFSLRFTGLG